MTAKEFNEKYRQWLEEGHYGLDIDYPNVVAFLDQLFGEYLTGIEGFQYSQIKMKYDHARFYFTIDSDATDYDTNQALKFLVETHINILWKS